MLKPDELVPELDSAPENTQESLSTKDNKDTDLEQEKLRSGPPNRCAHRSHFGWLRRIFSTSKPTSSPTPNPEKINSSGEKLFKKWRYSEALKFYDRAIELSPKNVTYLSNRAAALSSLGRIGEALNQWEEAIKLDPQSAQARHGLGMSLLSLGHVDEAMKLVEEASYNKYDLDREAYYLMRVLRVEALLKLSWVSEAHQTALKAAAFKVEPLPASFSQPKTRFFGMLCRAYAYFVKSQLNFALERYKDAAEYAAKALEIEPHNTEIKIFKNNVELVQRALSSSRLEKWAEAVRDYEILHEALPYDKVIAKSLSQAQVALKQSRREVVLNMESGGDVKEISSLEELKAALACPDKSVKIIYF
ncbi:hypothetical protein Bca101_062190 [Brassica carinata]